MINPTKSPAPDLKLASLDLCRNWAECAKTCARWISGFLQPGLWRCQYRSDYV